MSGVFPNNGSGYTNAGNHRRQTASGTLDNLHIFFTIFVDMDTMLYVQAREDECLVNYVETQINHRVVL